MTMATARLRMEVSLSFRSPLVNTIKINSCHYFESCINDFDADQNKLLEIYGEQLGHKYGLTPWR